MDVAFIDDRRGINSPLTITLSIQPVKNEVYQKNQNSCEEVYLIKLILMIHTSLESVPKVNSPPDEEILVSSAKMVKDSSDVPGSARAIDRYVVLLKLQQIKMNETETVACDIYHIPGYIYLIPHRIS